MDAALLLEEAFLEKPFVSKGGVHVRWDVTVTRPGWLGRGVSRGGVEGRVRARDGGCRGSVEGVWRVWRLSRASRGVAQRVERVWRGEGETGGGRRGSVEGSRGL